MGRGLGIESIRLNVHYTDGAYADEATKTQKMATDGLRFHYTPDFRPYTSLEKSILDIGTATRELVVPPGEPRFFVSRSCKVGTTCKDATDDQLQNAARWLGLGDDAESMFGGDLSCTVLKPFCTIGGEIGPYVQRLCPASCGFCEKYDDRENPFNPDSYRLTSVHYHAHLLGTEMYTTLLREENGTEALPKQLSSPEMTATDLKSKEFWIFDDQATTQFDFEMVKGNTIMRGQELKAGDTIQATCVYDSTYRTEDTRFGLSTYDEMCITTLRVTFETPVSLLASGNETDSSDVAIDLALYLSNFKCDEDETTDVYSGVLTEDEDARNIWKDHPINDAEGCTYPVLDLIVFNAGFLPSARNCPASDANSYICGQLDDPDAEFLPNVEAGASCQGGTYNERDSNDGLTEGECVEGGGEFVTYTCNDIEFFMQYDAVGLSSDVTDYLLTNWYQPKCCSSPNMEAKTPVSICGDYEMLPDVNAGTSCLGGTFNERDTNDGLTESECREGGGATNPYTCIDIQNYLNSQSVIDSAAVEYIVTNWYEPKCCSSNTISETEPEANEIVSSAPGFADSGKVLALLSGAVVTILAMAW